MKQMARFLDNASISLTGTKKTSEGYLVADAFAARTGIQLYAGAEVGRPDLPVVRVYRPENEVFATDSLRSFNHIAITNDHPTEAVTSDNWAKLAKGETSTDVLRDGERLRIPLILKDAAAIKLVEDGKRELSVGYTCELVFESGLTKDGQSYDVVQKNIRANHIALVDRGRAGPEFRIGDNWGITPITTDQETQMTTRTVTIDGISIVTTDQGAQVIEKLQAANAKLVADAATQVETAKKTVEAKDAEIGELKVQLKKAQDSIPSGATLDKMVADRTALISDAKRIAKDIKVEGLSDADIRKAAVAAVYGDDMVKDSSEAEINGMFRAATKDSAKNAVDPLRKALATNDVQTGNDNGQAAYEKRIGDAWKTA